MRLEAGDENASKTKYEGEVTPELLEHKVQGVADVAVCIFYRRLGVV